MIIVKQSNKALAPLGLYYCDFTQTLTVKDGSLAPIGQRIVKCYDGAFIFVIGDGKLPEGVNPELAEEAILTESGCSFGVPYKRRMTRPTDDLPGDSPDYDRAWKNW